MSEFDYLTHSVQQPALKAALIKAVAGDRPLSFAEVDLIVSDTLGGKRLLYQEFLGRQTMLKSAVVSDERSKRLIEDCLLKHYHIWLFNSEKKKFRLPYSVDHISRTTAHDRRPGHAMSPVYLTIHSTANANSTARNERAWLTNDSNRRTASFHLVVDQKEAIECIPLKEGAWHAGDGVNGTGNRKSIGLEICESGNRAATLSNAVALAGKILRDRSWDVSKLKRHHDWSSKNCPRILIDPHRRVTRNQTFDWFKKEVEKLL